MHFAISHRPTRGSISPYNIAGLISEVSEEVAAEIAKNCRRWQLRHSHLRPPSRGLTATSIRIHLIFPETRVIGLHFCRWVGLSSFNFVQYGLQKTHLFCTTECVLAVQGRSGSSKVDDFGTNQSKARICDFLLVLHCDYGPTPILHRFWDTATYWLKLPIFPTRLSFGALAPYMFPLEFCGEVNHEETRVMELSYREDRMIVAWVVLTQCQRVTDRRTDRRTDLL